VSYGGAAPIAVASKGPLELSPDNYEVKAGVHKPDDLMHYGALSTAPG
jgi:hypothetical protein